MDIRYVVGSLISLVAIAPALGGVPLPTAFTYQGQLKEGDVPLNGQADFEFTLWSLPSGGSVVGATQLHDEVPVVNGLFTVVLEFDPPPFDGSAVWLAVAVRTPPGNGSFTPLNPGQNLWATPYALFALNAATALSAPTGHALDAADGNPTDALFVDNAGKVGIGTNTPFGKLDVRDAGTVVAHLDGTSTLGAWLSIKSSTPDGHQWAIVTTGTDNGEGPGDLVFYDATTGRTRMDIDGPTGNVGIGTTSPDNTLHVMKGSAGAVTGYVNAPLVVENSTHAYINLLTPDANERGILFGSPTEGATAGGIIYNAAATPEGLQFRTGGNVNRMAVGSTGNVGIGTASPTAKLEVRGNVKLGPSGQYFAPGGEENLRIVRGVIAAAGGILAGSGFQVSRPFTGGYDIAFDTPFSGLPAVTASANLLNGTFPFVSVVTVSASQVRFVVRTETGLNADRDVYFIAIGPR